MCIRDRPKGSIVVEDLGYTDYAWYAQLTAQKIFFVTRQKRNACYEVLKHHKVNKTQGLLSDQTIRLTGAKSQECLIPLRRIAYRDAATGKRYVFLTNHFKLAAKTISDTKSAGRSRSSSVGSNRTSRSRPSSATRKTPC